MTIYSIQAKPTPLASLLSDAPWRFLNDLDLAGGERTEPPAIEWRLDQPGSPDWLSTITRTRVISSRSRDVLEPLLGPRDTLQWIPATLLTAAGQRLPYWVMHFPDPFDPYDPGSTDHGPSGLPMPDGGVLSPAALTGHQIIAPPQQSAQVFITDRVLTAIRDARLTGWFIRNVSVAAI